MLTISVAGTVKNVDMVLFFVKKIVALYMMLRVMGFYLMLRYIQLKKEAVSNGLPYKSEKS